MSLKKGGEQEKKTGNPDDTFQPIMLLHLTWKGAISPQVIHYI